MCLAVSLSPFLSAKVSLRPGPRGSPRKSGSPVAGHRFRVLQAWYLQILFASGPVDISHSAGRRPILLEIRNSCSFRVGYLYEQGGTQPHRCCLAPVADNCEWQVSSIKVSLTLPPSSFPSRPSEDQLQKDVPRSPGGMEPKYGSMAEDRRAAVSRSLVVSHPACMKF